MLESTKEMLMKSRRVPLRAALILASSLVGCVAPAVIVDEPPFTIATGAPGGVYLPIGNAICRMFNLAERRLTMPCLAVISDGSVENLKSIGSGKTALGLAQSDLVYAAYRGEGSFAARGPDSQLRTLVALHSEALAVIARPGAGTREIEDLRGRRISVGKSGERYAAVRDDLLAALGWTPGDFAQVLELGLAEQNRALCDGRVDAIMFEAAQPNGFVQEATIGCSARLLRLEGPVIERLLAAHPYYVASVIPAGMYDGNPNDVPTFGTRALLVTSARQSDELAHAVVQAIFENFADFRRLHPALSALRIADLVPTGVGAPLHPGALRYYREAGLAP